MNNLENLAKIRFEQYSQEQTGKQYNWYHLPHKRKLAWMQEVLDGYLYIIKDMKSRIKLEPVPSRMNTAYAMGRVEGVNSEKMRYAQELTNLADDLQDELEEFDHLHNQRIHNQQKWGDQNG